MSIRFQCSDFQTWNRLFKGDKSDGVENEKMPFKVGVGSRTE